MFPEASVVNPRHPATMNLYFPSAHLVYNTVLSALSKMNPSARSRPRGSVRAVTIGYRKARGGKPAVLYELLNTSLGGTSRNDGVAVVMAMNHFTPGAPVEIFESEYPLRVRAFELVCDSAGAGTFPRRAWICARIRSAGGQRAHGALVEPPVRLARTGGGGSPRLSRVVVNPHGASARSWGPLELRLLKAGDVIRFERSGGAGFGDPLLRAREAVADDVRNGYVSREAAAMSVYGQPQDGQ